MKTINQYILPTLFLLFLVTPAIIQKLNLIPNNIQEENRAIATKPELDVRHLDNYPAAFEKFYNDNFGLRAVGVKLYNNFNYFFLKKSPAPQKAILGKKGWLFSGENISHFQGIKRFSSQDLKELEVAFIKRNNFLKQHNCKFIYVVIPGKKEIYPEYVPDEYYRYSKFTLTDQFIDMLRTKTDIEVIDLRKILKNQKTKYPILYHKIDNHWNDIGAFFSYQVIIDSVNKYIPTFPAYQIQNYKFDTTEVKGGNVADMLGIKDKVTDFRIDLAPTYESHITRLPQKYEAPKRFPYPWSYERRFENSNGQLPRLMMIHDSFGEYFYKSLPEHFSYSLFLFDSWEFKLHAKKVLDEKPDVFILATVEELIPNILKNLYREENQIPDVEVQ